MGNRASNASYAALRWFNPAASRGLKKTEPPESHVRICARAVFFRPLEIAFTKAECNESFIPLEDPGWQSFIHNFDGIPALPVSSMSPRDGRRIKKGIEADDAVLCQLQLRFHCWVVLLIWDAQ